MGWRSPLVVAILAATCAAAGNAVVAIVNGLEQRKVEGQRAEETRILEMIKAGNPDKAAENLGFLLSAGLIENRDRSDKIRRFLNSRRPGTGPSLPTSGGITQQIEPVLSSSLPPDHPLRNSTRAVGLISAPSDDGLLQSCTGFLITPELLLTGAHCISDANLARNATFLVGTHRYPIRDIAASDRSMDFTIARVEGDPGKEVGTLRLSDRDPRAGDPVALVFFRGGKSEQLVDVPSTQCAISSVKTQTLEYRCSTGAGSSGAPLLSPQGDVVYGMHLSRVIGDQRVSVATAVKSSKILKRIRDLNPSLLDQLQK